MRTMLAVLAMAAVVAGGLCGAEQRANPYKKAKVGDWVSYSTATNQMPGGTTKQTVKARDEKEVTLLIETEVMGQKSSQEVKIPLDQPYDPAEAGAPSNMKIEKIGEGKETVTVAGKQYECQWFHVKMKMKAPTGDVLTTSKSWICPDVPLGGVVRTESELDMNVGGQAIKTQTKMELTDCGTGQ